MALKCIDISTWQRNVDFAKVKAAGISAVIIRAGYGRESSQKDNRFESHYQGAEAAGMKIGAYWYSYAKSPDEAALEAKACLACIKGKRFDLPVYFDMEEASQTALGKTTLTQMTERFCDTIIAGGYRAGVYSNLNWLTNYLDHASLKAKYSIWLAQWADSHSLPCDIWQYSSKGSVGGIGGYVDMNLIENTAVIGGSAEAVKTAETAQGITMTAALKVNYPGSGQKRPALAECNRVPRKGRENARRRRDIRREYRSCRQSVSEKGGDHVRRNRRFRHMEKAHGSEMSAVDPADGVCSIDTA